jgi:hypothetical protein
MFSAAWASRSGTRCPSKVVPCRADCNIAVMPMSVSTNQQIQIGDDLWSGARAVDRRDAALQRLFQHQRDAVEPL